MSAMVAHRNLNSAGSSLSDSITRLSTGLRINNAGDDPSGLIASESFRSQILSIDAANRNNQDAINYSKTAEAALAEVNKLLSDARALAIASGNTATLSSTQIQANQDQLYSISNSITRISQNTQFGTRRLLDGSSGIQSQISNAASLQGMSFVGTFAGAPITASAPVTMTMTTLATRASYTSSVLTGGNVLNGGSFNINGISFSFPVGTPATTVVNSINAATSQTGVSANFDAATNQVSLASTTFGSNAKINFADPSGVLTPVGTAQQTTGIDAVANVNVNGTTVQFRGGLNGSDGLTMRDSDGNSIRLTELGNTGVGTPGVVGRVYTGTATFQIGANANQTALLGLPNLNSAQLGNDVVAGLSMANLDLSSTAGSTQALQIIDRAIEQVSSARGRIGQFTRYILDSNARSLTAAKENMTASESTIRDVDMASEMTNFTKYQVMQQAGVSILSQANQLPQQVLSLLRG
jgi:flagellin